MDLVHATKGRYVNPIQREGIRPATETGNVSNCINPGNPSPFVYLEWVRDPSDHCSVWGDYFFTIDREYVRENIKNLRDNSLPHDDPKLEEIFSNYIQSMGIRRAQRKEIFPQEFGIAFFEVISLTQIPPEVLTLHTSEDLAEELAIN